MKGLFGFGKKNDAKNNAQVGHSETQNSPVSAPLPQKKYLVQYDRKGCIGAGACEAVAPEYWKVNEDRKAELKGAVLNAQTGFYEIGIDENDLEKMNASANGCPKNVIHITNTETGSKLI